MQIQITIRT